MHLKIRNRKKLMWIIAITILVCFALLNVSAYMHAYRMSHFVSGGTPTPKPESLSLFQKIKILITGVTVPKPQGEEKPSDRNMEYSNISLVTEDKIRLDCWHIPAEKSRGMIVMFHGYASCKAYLLAETELFNKAGWEVLLVDFRGSGDSDGSTTTLGTSEAEEIATALNWAKQKAGQKPVILFGTSMGAVAIMNAIHRKTANPDAVILECPFDRMLNTVKNRFDVMGVPSFPSAHLLVFWGGVQHGFNGFKHNAVDYAESITCPVLLLHGSDDPRVTKSEIKNIKQNIKTNCTFHIFEETSHESYCQAMPEEYRTVTSQWLENFSESHNL
jgi:alpha-beta hydrolase superfamily lysophospholipase